MRPITIKEAVISLEALPEHASVRGNAIASGDKDYDRAVEDGILSELGHNEWAWCIAHVRVEWQGITGDSYLGCCNYPDKMSFMEDDYYDDMIDEAMCELNKKVVAVQRG